MSALISKLESNCLFHATNRPKSKYEKEKQQIFTFVQLELWLFDILSIKNDKNNESIVKYLLNNQ